MKRREILIDSELYRGLEGWAQALGYTVDRLAELCIKWGFVYLVAMVEGGLDPAAECRSASMNLKRPDYGSLKVESLKPERAF